MGKKRNRKHRDFKYNYDTNETNYVLEEELKQLFDKVFTFKKPTPPDHEWVLPNTDLWFKSEPWSDGTLHGYKTILNEVKASLSNYEISEWHSHTSLTNRAGAVMSHVRRHFNPELCTQAWCKFYEVISRFPELLQSSTFDNGRINSLHLCEAPGAFIASINHYLVSRAVTRPWTWHASTLNPYYEGNSTLSMINDDRFIAETLDKWLFGVDDTGDIMNPANIDHIKACISAGIDKDGPVGLVTADGSIDCSDTPGEQELVTSNLHFCEVITCLTVLTPGGNFVLKMFTLFEDSSICLLYLINCCFQNVHVYKPATSKAGNSEVYVVCLGFLGLDYLQIDCLLNQQFTENATKKCLFERNLIKDSYFDQHKQCSKLFMDFQIQTIEENKQLFVNRSVEMSQKLEELRIYCAQMYVEKCSLASIDSEEHIVPKYKPPPAKRMKHQHPVLKSKHQGSYNERQQSKSLPWHEILQTMNLHDVSLDQLPICVQGRSELTEEEIANWSFIEGKRIQDINSTKFADSSLLDQYLTLLKHSTKTNSQYMAMPDGDVLSKSLQILMADDNLSGMLLVGAPEAIKNQISSIFTDLNINLDDGGPCLHVYIRQNSQDNGREEIIRKMDILEDLIQSLQKLQKDDMLLIAIPGCLTRFLAGIVYILHTLFFEIHIIPSGGTSNQLFLLAVGFHSAIPALVQVLCLARSKMQAFKGSDRDVLQIVPIYNLSEASFLPTLKNTNNMHLRLKINRLISEQMLLVSEKDI